MRKQPPIQLILPKAALQRFKQRALRTSNEILAALVGTITRENDRITRVVVEEIFYPRLDESSPEGCAWNLLDLAKHQIRVQPRVIVGSIHSHPYVDYIGLSRDDLETAEHYGEIVFGVFTYWKPADKRNRETSLDFYCQGKPIKFEVI